jgi:hypothetical protein
LTEVDILAPKLVNTRVWVEIPKIPKKDWVKYLVLIDWHYDKLGDILKIQPSEKFNEFVMISLQGYMDGSKLPSAAILPAIMNLAEDNLAGRDMTIRAGDYISLQKEFRGAH